MVKLGRLSALKRGGGGLFNEKVILRGLVIMIFRGCVQCTFMGYERSNFNIDKLI